MQLHANCVAFEGHGLLIVGKSGSGKSALSLQLIALGARLVADDRTVLTEKSGWPCASAPAQTRGLIEAHGLGILSAPPLSSARVALVVDLDHTEQKRLPPHRTKEIMGQDLPYFYKIEGPHFASALKLLALGGRTDP